MNPIEELSPKYVWKNFYALTQIPHPSGHTEKVAQFLVDFAKQHGAEAYIDEAGNVVMSKGATPGYEDRAVTVLQAHMDMVPQKTKDSKHNFETDPLDVYIDGEWVTARDTTLGADDGMGVAAAMAIIEDDTVEHGPIEVLITRDEETGMNGAFGLKSGELKGRYLLNLDSEEEGEITIGCAGGIDILCNMEYQEMNVEPEGMLCYDITIKGGCEPYTMNTVVKYKGDKIFTSKEVLVTDGAGDTVKVKANIVSASNEKNEAPALPRLKEDMTFADKLVTVAKSQLGYRESNENFILQGGDAVQGWSFYGGWYGAPYEEWCAMFVSYCLVNAGIGEDIMPHSGNCNRWKGDLGARYIDDEDEYIPEPGDIIFFHHNRVSNDPNYPNHIGIVTQYDADSDTVYTVEGNSGKSVRDRQYERASSVIVGYASMRACMLEHDSVYRTQLGDQLASNLEAFRAQYSEKD